MEEKISIPKTITLVGMMGAGKTTVGRNLAKKLGIPFKDADKEIEEAAGMTISEIFDTLGEAAFRDGEAKIIKRLVAEEDPHILALGGGAFINPETRQFLLENAITVWLSAPPEILFERVKKNPDRPLLHTPNPRETFLNLAQQRYPIYAESMIHVDSPADDIDQTIADTLNQLSKYIQTAA